MSNRKENLPADGAAPLTPAPGQLAASEGAPSAEEWIKALKQGIEKTRLRGQARAEILAALPSPEEQERLYRELIAKGGLSSEEFLASLGLHDERRP